MTNNEILEGLKTAIERNYTLEQAMMSFFNAGYKKEEIEEAARFLYTNYPQIAAKAKTKSANPGPTISPAPTHQNPTQKPLPAKAQAQISQKPAAETQKAPAIQQPAKSKQEISKYEGKTKPKGKIITILIIIFLLIAVGLTIGFFLFKEEVMQFFSNLF